MIDRRFEAFNGVIRKVVEKHGGTARSAQPRSR
jgi:hypothetical protein